MTELRTFRDLFAIPLRNGLNRPKAVRGVGQKMINMGELFSNDRIADIPMDLVLLSSRERDDFMVRKNDLLFARQSLVLSGAGKCSLYTGASYATFESHIIRARLNEAISDPRFYYYFFRSPAGRSAIEAIVEQVAAAGIRGSDLAGISVPYPPVSEQRAIASILGALDDKIELNRKMSATLEAIARALFKSWFVDFDPVRAKAEGRDPGLPAEIAALFPDSLDNEGKPEGWERVALREAADVLSGGTPTKSSADFWNGPIPWISPKVMMNIHVFDSTDRVMSEAIGNGTRLAASGSVLVMVRGMGLHHGVRISQARRDVTFNQDVKALVPKRLSGTHLLFGMLDAAPYLFSKVQASGHGTGTLPTDIIDRISFVTPTNGDLCAKLISPLDALNNRIATSSAESATLSIIRDTLLPKLISGELRVGEAELVLAASA